MGAQIKLFLVEHYKAGNPPIVLVVEAADPTDIGSQLPIDDAVTSPALAALMPGERQLRRLHIANVEQTLNQFLGGSNE